MTQPDLARLEGLLAKASSKYDDHSDWLDDVHGYGTADRELTNYAAYLPALLARVRELESALKPFAEHVSHLDSGSHSTDLDADDFPATLYCGGVPGIRHKLTVGDLRRARATLNKDNPDAG